MMKHIVCFKLNDNSYETKLKTKEVLMSMMGRVPTVKAIEVGIDFLGSERSYDIILQVLLNSKDDLEAYQNDEYHCGVVKEYIKTVKKSAVAVDYEL